MRRWLFLVREQAGSYLLSILMYPQFHSKGKLLLEETFRHCLLAVSYAIKRFLEAMNRVTIPLELLPLFGST